MAELRTKPNSSAASTKANSAFTSAGEMWGFVDKAISEHPKTQEQ